MLDLLFLNCLVVDGSGRPGRSCPVAVKGDKIHLPAASVSARQVIDGRGLVLAPGFIDIHSHTTLPGLAKSKGESKLSQGITTEITGNCGIMPDPEGPMELNLGSSEAGYAEYLAHFRRPGLPLNLGFFIGHGTIRDAVLARANREPSDTELAKLKKMVALGMENGALGLSTGLVYPPGIFAKTRELVELAQVAAAHGGIYATHLRSEGDGLLEAVAEAIAIARDARIPLQVSHLKATGRANWGKVALALNKMEEAYAQGLKVNCDFYPYIASSTGLNSQLPDWAHEGGWTATRRHLEDPVCRERIYTFIAHNLEHSVPAQDIVVSSIESGKNLALEGKTLAEIGEAWGLHPARAMLDLLLEEEGTPGMIKFSMTEEDLTTVALHPLSMVGSDGVAMELHDAASRRPHPRNFGTFPRVLRHFWREEKLLNLETAVHKMTGAPAAKLGLNNRGLIQEGGQADLVLFDPETIGDAATYAQPHQLCRGIEGVWVNGALAWDRGHCLDAASGQLI